MTLSVHHLAVVASDLERSRRFYSDVLGLAEIRRWDDDEGALRSIWLDLGGSAFFAIERAGAEGRRIDEAPGFHCVALSIPRVEREAWMARLAEAGIPIERESPFTVYVRDPDGNLVGLSHHPEER